MYETRGGGYLNRREEPQGDADTPSCRWGSDFYWNSEGRKRGWELGTFTVSIEIIGGPVFWKNGCKWCTWCRGVIKLRHEELQGEADTPPAGGGPGGLPQDFFFLKKVHPEPIFFWRICIDFLKKMFIFSPKFCEKLLHAKLRYRSTWCGIIFILAVEDHKKSKRGNPLAVGGGGVGVSPRNFLKNGCKSGAFLAHFCQYAISQLRIVRSGLHLVTYLDVGNFCDKMSEKNITWNLCARFS